MAIGHALRIFKNNPAFSLMTIVMLALGIGACTAIFTVINAVLLKPLPYPDADRLVQIQEVGEQGKRMNVPEANYLDWHAASHSFDGMAIFQGAISEDVVRVDNQPIRIRYTSASREFFDILGTKPLVGSGFLPEHFRREATPAAVVSYGFWKRVLGGSNDLSNHTIEASGLVAHVVGVLPPEFNFPAGVDAWLPREVLPFPVLASRSAHNFSVLARLKPGVSAAAASNEMAAIAKSIHDQYPDVTAVSAVVVPLQEHLTESVNLALPVLFAAVAMLLLVACANVMNLTLTHVAARQREFAVRTALGASSTTLIRLFMSQSLALSLIGGALGIGLSLVGVPALLALSGGNLPRMDEIHADWRVLLFGVVLSLGTGVVLGLMPALRLRRINLDEMLKQGGRSQSSGGAAKAIRSGLVIAQIAMTIILLAGAALLGRSFVKILQVDLGFRTESRLSIESMMPAGTANLQTTLRSRTQEILQAISTVPGVIAAAGVRALPLTHNTSNGRFLIEHEGDSGDIWPEYNVATDGYFNVMGIPLIRGRLFNATDGPNTTQVAIISQYVADHVWPGQDPIGKRINTGNMDGDPTFMTVVGVVGNIHDDPARPATGMIYVNYLQRGNIRTFDFVVRAAGDPETLQRTIAERIRQIEPDASVRTQTLDRLFASNLANRRFNLVLIGFFGGTALLLALLGIYAVTSYSVAQRTQEIGIRMALGAAPNTVAGLFLSEGSKLLFIGIAIGLVGAIAVSRALSALLFNVSATDATAYIFAVIPMILAAFAANLIPARRAARIDPAWTLQQGQ